VPEETLFTLGMFFKLEKHRTISSEKDNYAPKEKHGKEVKGH